jgi:5'(3')-deoxyribonucleotidase
VRVGLDIDGVVADFAGWANEWLARHHDTDPKPVDRWDWYLGYENGETAWRKLWDHVAENGVFRRLSLLPHAFAAIRALDRAGHDIVYVTARNPRYYDDTLHWLEARRLPLTELHLERDKWSVPTDIFLDDQPGNVTDLLEHGVNAYLFRRPWNEDTTDLPAVQGWGEFVRKVDDAQHS